MRIKYPILAAFALAAASGSAQEPTEPPAALTRLIDCRSVQSEGERLACYDAAVAAFQEAEQSRQLVVMDRQQVRRTRRSLFGLVLPDLNIFGDDSEDDDSVGTLETTIRSAAQNANGRWVFTLEDGARWVQIDSRELPRDPRGGHPIRIRRAAMGSYLANVDGQIAIRVRRER